MSHQVIIGGSGGGNRIASDSSCTSRVEWTPSHTLSPQQVYRRIERAERKLDEIEQMLASPGGDEAHVE